MMRSLPYAGVAGLALITALASAAEAQTVLRFSHTDNPGGSRQAAAELLTEKATEYTDGRYEVRIFPSGQPANDPKAIEQLQLGGPDFTVTATGGYGTHPPSPNLTAMPFLVDTYEQDWDLYDNSDRLQVEFDKLPDLGMRVLATWEAVFRSFTTADPLAPPRPRGA